MAHDRFVGVPRRKKYRKLRLCEPQSLCKLPSAHPRHDDVGDEEIDLGIPLERLESLSPSFALDDRVTRRDLSTCFDSECKRSSSSASRIVSLPKAGARVVGRSCTREPSSATLGM